MGGGIHPEREWGELLMPASYTITYHRNHTSSDTTTQSYTQSSATFTLKTIDELGWDAPTGYTFQAWNTAADGSGVTRYPGNTTNSYTWYAIWEQLPAVTYTTTSTELTTVADAIRAKGGTSAALEWPSGFAQAIADIPSGGGGGTYIEMNQQDYSYHGLIFNSQWSLLPTRTMADAGESIVIEGQQADWIVDSIVGVNSGTSIPFTTSGRQFTFTMPNESVSISWYYND